MSSSAELHVALVHRLLDAGETGKAEGVVLVEDRDARDAKIVGEVFDPGFGLLEIRTADIDDVTVEWIAQKFRAGKRADERHLGRGGDRLAGFRGRRADRADKREDLVVRDRALGGFDGFFRLVAVVDRLELELAATHTAGAVGFLECRQHSFAHALAERLRRPAQGRDLPEQDPVSKYAVLRVQRSVGKTEDSSPENAEPVAIGPHGRYPHQQVRVDFDRAPTWLMNR
jgi:hypothetical protein